ncbi:MAG: hypothetical protein CUN49_05870 [Candidatus Thermofonsia Clade 1 bacterium]|uniref:HD domain-containing protein n=1 Tax=Candidatus Thermofonsia Clade 1 bacterium TaxID=2364210 RepID=A0A2M8PFN5_9CHLR|nr:MAG: hypothetical protein CUN49_05870 [Candidatus Thermofonsia Clade 1 bacterium]RMF53042.1 MAG: hypothetical protein D6749_03365 [Chloroflexota bacterium]
MVKGQRALLPPEDEERLKVLAETATPSLRQRAKAILAWHDGLTAAETAQLTGLSVNQVQYLWRKYRQKGLDLFMAEEDIPAESAERAPVPAAMVEDDRISLETLCQQYQVDMAHARHVSALATHIFDAAENVHRLAPNMRPLLEAAALVHNIAYEIDPPNHHLRGRDILINTPLRGFSDEERRILACTTSFHRKKVNPEAEPVYMALPEDLRRDALALSAILRVADGLDHSQTQSTHIDALHLNADEVEIVVSGDHAADDAAQAQKKADLWAKVFPVTVRILPVPPGPSLSPETAPRQALLRQVTASIRLDETVSLARAGRLFAKQTLERVETLMRYLQHGDLTVLPTLAREASRLTDAIILADAKEHRKEAKWFADAVNEARLLLALAERAAMLVEDSQEQAAVLERVQSWHSEARAACAAIDAARFKRMAEGLRLALTEDVDPNEKALAVYHVGRLLWEQLTALRTVMEQGTSVDEALAAVRRLQDYLLAFRDLLGAEVSQVLDMLTPLESYLTAIQVAQALLNRLERLPAATTKKGRKPKNAPSAPDAAIEALRASQNELIEMLADSLSNVWASVNSPIFRRAFALAVAAP